MGLKKVYQKTSLVLIFCTISITLMSQKNMEIKGKWKAQNYGNSCWAASLSNLTRVNWESSNVLPESFFYNKFTAGISPRNIEPIFKDSIFSKTFNYNSVHNKILSFESIKQNFNVSFPRPMIYSYGYDDGNGGHFVNIIGTRQINTTSQAHNNWLLIFDPKPDSLGNRYLKNYISYRMVEEAQYPLQGTYYNIVKKELKRAKQITTDAFLNNESPIKGLINGTLLASVDSILRNPGLKDFIGEGNISYTELFSIPIIKNEQQIVRNDTSTTQTSHITVETVNSILFFPICNGVIKGGAIVQELGNNRYLIDRVEDIGHFDILKSIIISKIKSTQNFGQNNKYHKMDSFEILDFNNGKAILNDISDRNSKGYDLFQLKKENIQSSLSFNQQIIPLSFPLDIDILKNWKFNNFDNENSFNKILKRN
ncbi:hypothetical protein EGI26_10600 [Lacihabitans sp. CCS-44]|nr:hypothetical protein [Lacihabitans sp. CCS-44]